jgi:hypothetical protein
LGAELFGVLPGVVILCIRSYKGGNEECCEHARINEAQVGLFTSSHLG